MAVAAHVGAVVEFTDDNEVVTVIAKSNGKKLVWTFPFEIFEQCVAQANDVVAKHNRRKVVPFRHR